MRTGCFIYVTLQVLTANQRGLHVLTPGNHGRQPRYDTDDPIEEGRMGGNHKNGGFHGACDLSFHSHRKPHRKEQGTAQKLQNWLSDLPWKTHAEKTGLALPRVANAGLYLKTPCRTQNTSQQLHLKIHAKKKGAHFHGALTICQALF